MKKALFYAIKIIIKKVFTLNKSVYICKEPKEHIL